MIAKQHSYDNLVVHVRLQKSGIVIISTIQAST